uniref:Serpentine receptor class gamma n=1 Tax=Steinernema glaseri TaxID=37863 RepID=A0A1I7Z239_9BILA
MYDFRKSAYLVNYFLSAALTAITLVLNSSLFLKLWARRQGDAHLKTIYLSIFWHVAFALVTCVHSTYMILYFTGSSSRVDWLIFISGDLVYSTEVSIGICNIINAFDRVMAMWQPIRYYQSYQIAIQRMAVLFTVMTTSSFVIAFYTTRHETMPTVVFAFASYINLDVLFSLHWFDCATSIINILVSIVFLRELHKFVTQMKTNMVIRPAGSAKVDQLIKYQIIADFIILIAPILTTSTAKYGWHADWPSQIGPYPITLFTLYTAVCALLFKYKLRVN